MHDFFTRDMGFQVAKLRIAHGLSQQELAEKIGLSELDIENLESGNHTPKIDEVLAIAIELGYRVEFKFTKFF